MKSERFGQTEDMVFTLYNEFEDPIVARLVFPVSPLGGEEDDIHFVDFFDDSPIPHEPLGEHVMLRIKLRPDETKFLRYTAAPKAHRN